MCRLLTIDRIASCLSSSASEIGADASSAIGIALEKFPYPKMRNSPLARLCIRVHRQLRLDRAPLRPVLQGLSCIEGFLINELFAIVHSHIVEAARNRPRLTDGLMAVRKTWSWKPSRSSISTDRIPKSDDRRRAHDRSAGASRPGCHRPVLLRNTSSIQTRRLATLTKNSAVEYLPHQWTLRLDDTPRDRRRIHCRRTSRMVQRSTPTRRIRLIHLTVRISVSVMKSRSTNVVHLIPRPGPLSIFWR